MVESAAAIFHLIRGIRRVGDCEPLYGMALAKETVMKREKLANVPTLNRPAVPVSQ